jgi:monofunctional biosynthetic peptidoglycan transglycosylase
MRFLSKLTAPLLLTAAFIFLSSGIMLMFMPSLDGVEKGVFIKVKFNGRLVDKRFVSPRSPDFVKTSELPRYVYGAIITSEDEDFYTHNGISLDEIIDAARYDLRHATLKCGGSTITQQLVKNIYLSRKKTFSRKIIEAATAMMLEHRLTKKQILNYYINIVEFGDGIYGIRQASRAYFGKAPEDLTPREAAMLAVVMPEPGIRGKALYDWKSNGFQKRRVANLLYRMEQNGYLKTGSAGDKV